MDELKFRLDAFEGPLDLLLSLIIKQKIDIYDIPIAVIFDQYMEYIEEARLLDMEVAGEFITMAAELMLIKSRMLLPKVQNCEEDPRAALAAAIAEYKRAKEAAEVLQMRYGEYAGRFVKETDEIDVDMSFVSPHDADLLVKAFQRILRRRRIGEETRNALPEDAVGDILKRRVTPVAERIISLMRTLCRRGKMTFEDLLMTSRSRSDLIASFAAILELVKGQRLIIEPYGNGEDEVYVSLRRERMNKRTEKQEISV